MYSTQEVEFKLCELINTNVAQVHICDKKKESVKLFQILISTSTFYHWPFFLILNLVVRDNKQIIIGNNKLFSCNFGSFA